MNPGTENFSVRETVALRPRLRDGLRFSVQEENDRRVCVIEDSAASRFHRVGLDEYRFIRALDGTRPIAGILGDIAREGGAAFTQSEAVQILGWLKNQHLLAVESARAGPSALEQDEQATRAAMTWLNPLVVKVPLFRPDRFFTACERVLRPALGWGAFFVWFVVVLTGVAHVGMDWRRFHAAADGFFDRDNWLWLFVAWAGLKIAHELSHGIFCKHFGAAVREAGVIFVVFFPMGYVDATASVGLASRWRRIMVATAGLYIEFFLAGLAAVVWARSAPGALHTLAYDVVITGTVLTLLFNANPLMRFDGYFILGDLLQVPNLSTRGGTWMRRALTWVLLGAEPARELRPTTREGWIVAIYGAASWVWQWVVIAGLLLGASVALRGGGLLLAVIAGIAWVALPVGRFASATLEKIRTGAGTGSRLLVRAGVLSAVVAALVFVPWHRSVSSDGVVELAETQVLRAECPGFVVREWVRDGEMVAEGQLLLELSNSEDAAELAGRRLLLARQELRARLAYTRDDVAAFQAEQAKSAALRKEIAERERYLGTLQIRAPFAGQVTNRKLGRRRGVFFKAGEDVLHIGRAGERELKIAVSERDEPHFRGAVGKSLSVRIAGRAAVLSGQLTRVEARATQAPAHPALTALAGGPLAVRRSDEAPADSSRQADYELAQPYFTAIVRLAEGVPLAAGEMARVRFRSARTDTLWSEAQRAFSRWLKRYVARER